MAPHSSDALLVESSGHESDVRPPEPAAWRDRLRLAVDEALRHWADTDPENGPWGIAPAPRMFDTGAVAFALCRLPETVAVTAALQRASHWLAHAAPRAHHPLVRLMDELPVRLLGGERPELDLRDPTFRTPLFRHRALLLCALARFAGCAVASPISITEIRSGLGSYVRDLDLTVGRWGRADLLAMHVLFEWVAGAFNSARKAAGLLISLQSPEGDFGRDPINSAFACMALSVAAPGSSGLARSIEHVLAHQHPDGSWR